MTLRERLQALGTERGDLREARIDLGARTGEALLEVQVRRQALPPAASAHITLTEAAQLVGLSRESAYRLLKQAESRKA